MVCVLSEAAKTSIYVCEIIFKHFQSSPFESVVTGEVDGL